MITNTRLQKYKIYFLNSILISFLLIATMGNFIWFTLKNVNQKVDKLVNHTPVKAGLIYDMRISTPNRNLRLAMSFPLIMQKDKNEIELECRF